MMIFESGLLFGATLYNTAF